MYIPLPQVEIGFTSRGLHEAYWCLLPRPLQKQLEEPVVTKRVKGAERDKTQRRARHLTTILLAAALG